MKSLVVGFGSIGARHARILTTLGCEVAVISRREIKEYPCFKTVADAIETLQPRYVVIANETSQHHQTLTQLANLCFDGTVLVEKPIYHQFMEFPKNRFSNLFVAYNLRFHPLIQKLHRILKSEKIISVNIYAGQYLPEWHPTRDYRHNYSANKEAGGGVIRDLSHELDYMLWMFGRWRVLTAVAGHYSPLEIDSEDVCSILMVTEKCPVLSLQLNYLDRSGRRTILVNTDNKTISLDLISGILSINNESECYKIERDYTYSAQHQAIINSETDFLCSSKEGMDVMQLISAIEESARTNKWVAMS